MYINVNQCDTTLKTSDYQWFSARISARVCARACARARTRYDRVLTVWTFYTFRAALIPAITIFTSTTYLIIYNSALFMMSFCVMQILRAPFSRAKWSNALYSQITVY